jgi:hypothetical protein
MIDEVSRTVAADAHAEFMAELGQIIRKPTLGQVCDLARQARTQHSAQYEAARVLYAPRFLRPGSLSIHR